MFILGSEKMSLIPKEARLVTIIHMVNPTTFWATTPPEMDTEEEKLQNQQIKKLLDRTIFYEGDNFSPKIGEVSYIKKNKIGHDCFYFLLIMIFRYIAA